MSTVITAINNTPISNCAISTSSMTASTISGALVHGAIYYESTTTITLGHPLGDYICTAQELANKLKLLDLVLAQYYPELLV